MFFSVEEIFKQEYKKLYNNKMENFKGDEKSRALLEQQVLTAVKAIVYERVKYEIAIYQNYLRMQQLAHGQLTAEMGVYEAEFAAAGKQSQKIMEDRAKFAAETSKEYISLLSGKIIDIKRVRELETKIDEHDRTVYTQNFNATKDYYQEKLLENDSDDIHKEMSGELAFEELSALEAAENKQLRLIEVEFELAKRELQKKYPDFDFETSKWLSAEAGKNLSYFEKFDSARQDILDKKQQGISQILTANAKRFDTLKQVYPDKKVAVAMREKERTDFIKGGKFVANAGHYPDSGAVVKYNVAALKAQRQLRQAENVLRQNFKSPEMMTAKQVEEYGRIKPAEEALSNALECDEFGNFLRAGQIQVRKAAAEILANAAAIHETLQKRVKLDLKNIIAPKTPQQVSPMPKSTPSAPTADRVLGDTLNTNSSPVLKPKN